MLRVSEYRQSISSAGTADLVNYASNESQSYFRENSEHFLPLQPICEAEGLEGGSLDPQMHRTVIFNVESGIKSACPLTKPQPIKYFYKKFLTFDRLALH